MSQPEPARERMSQQRQQDERHHQSMLNRSEAEVHAAPDNEQTSEHARELMAQHRHHDENLNQSMLSRSSEEVGMTNDHENAAPEQT